MRPLDKVDYLFLGAAMTAVLALIGLTIEDHRVYSPIVGFMIWTLIGSLGVLAFRRFNRKAGRS